MKRRWALIIGIVALIGGVFWMRALASWRPQTFAKFPFNPTKILFSRDQKRLLVSGASGHSGDIKIWNWKTGADDRSRNALVKFVGDLDGLPDYPRVWLEYRQDRLISSTTAQRSVYLQDTVDIGSYFVNDNDYERVKSGWSNSRREIYGEARGEIWIWDWNGNLKERMRYAKEARNAIFSPDGKWLVAAFNENNQWKSGRFDVQTGKLAQILPRSSFKRKFSPDGRFLGCEWRDLSIGRQSEGFVSLRTSDWKTQWSYEGKSSMKWVPDGRIGIVKENGFEFRDATGKVLQSLPGPVNVFDWALSPDGDWIYSVEKQGIIRKWRAR